MAVPDPTPIVRFIHFDNLRILLARDSLHAPNQNPNDGLIYKAIQNEDVQNKRHITNIPCGPGGTIHDYVPFYFGYLSPMMLNLKTGRVPGYAEGQTPLIYLVSTAQVVRDSSADFVFSNGHGIATFTEWFDDLAQLDQVDWEMVYQRYWTDTLEDMDRQRRKQAEFLIYQRCAWSMIQEVVVVNTVMKARVEEIFANFPVSMHKPVNVRSGWYYY